MADSPPAPARRASRRPLMARIPAGFVQAVLKGHSGLGLAFAAAIYIVCLSGSLLVFYDEFLWWEAAGAPELSEVSPDAIQAAIADAVERGGAGVEHVYATLPSQDNPHLRIYVDAQEHSNWVADGDGTIVAPLDTPWSTFLSGLHIYLHLPATWGIFVVGMTGVALLSSLISGILAHPRIFRDAFHLRLGGSRRLQEADLHNRIGVWGLPFHFIVSLSGAFLGLVTVTVGVLGMAMFDGDTGRIYELFLTEEPVDNPAPAPLLDIRPMFEQAPADARLERIVLEHPTEQGAAALFEYRNDALMAGGADYAFNRAGELYYSKSLPDAAVGERVLGALGPLHFGWFGGPIVKVAYFVLGLGMTYLAVGGVNIWLARRRDKGRPAPRWERIWASLVWSQPLSYAVVAAIAVFRPVTPVEVLIPLWLCLTLAATAAAWVMPVGAIVRAGRFGTGMLLIAIAAGHVVLHAGAGVGSGAGAGSGIVPWVLDLAILAGGALLVLTARRPARPTGATIAG